MLFACSRRTAPYRTTPPYPIPRSSLSRREPRRAEPRRESYHAAPRLDRPTWWLGRGAPKRNCQGRTSPRRVCVFARGDTLPGVSLMVAVHDLRGDGANSRRRRRDITHRDERRGSLTPRSLLPPLTSSLLDVCTR